MANPHRPPSPFAVPNVRRFVLFRLFFNARFYYPVFTILFLDFGLTLAEFATLNAVWAATIVLLEVPSGALADTLGRRRLLVATGVMMVAEIGLLCVVPRGHSGLLLTVFVCNRILSGAGEASASGADEALAYDSLARVGLDRHWGRVLEVQMRVQAVGFVVAMSLGAAVYDPQLVNRLLGAVGSEMRVDEAVTLRLPLALTFLMALGALTCALGMDETATPAAESADCTTGRLCAGALRGALANTLAGGRWILATPTALVVILAGLLFDHVIRMVVTLSSQYYRTIGLPEASYGLIGSGLALLGLVTPRIGRFMAERGTPARNLAASAAVTLAGLWGLDACRGAWGIAPVALLMSVMTVNLYLQSDYLNRLAPTAQRATVLSFKGLAFNLGYGVVGLLYAGLLAALQPSVAARLSAASGVPLEDAVFAASLPAFPLYFALGLALLLIIARRRLGRAPRIG